MYRYVIVLHDHVHVIDYMFRLVQATYTSTDLQHSMIMTHSTKLLRHINGTTTRRRKDGGLRQSSGIILTVKAHQTVS